MLHSVTQLKIATVAAILIVPTSLNSCNYILTRLLPHLLPFEQIPHGFYHNSSNLLRAYKTYIRPLLEYASSTWSPSLITQIMALEMVQKKFTKRIPDISDLNYKDRLHSLKLQSLEHRRLICDLVLCYKIVHNNLCMTFTDLFKFPNITSPRRHSLQLYCPVLKSNLHKGSFAYRVISPWNSLPENIVCAPNSVTFKNRLSKFDLSKFLIFPCIVWIDLLQWIYFEKLFLIAQSCVAFQWFSMFFFVFFCFSSLFSNFKFRVFK